ncbi:hypothetical protein BS17DRAFT_822236 [Gyrodon lividus]|nr:hypothetical protein BS17DRAFT_822236 [Gyrodon lividus]
MKLSGCHNSKQAETAQIDLEIEVATALTAPMLSISTSEQPVVGDVSEGAVVAAGPCRNALLFQPRHEVIVRRFAGSVWVNGISSHGGNFSGPKTVVARERRSRVPALMAPSTVERAQKSTGNVKVAGPPQTLNRLAVEMSIDEGATLEGQEPYDANASLSERFRR